MVESTQEDIDAAVLKLKDAHQKAETYRDGGGNVRLKNTVEAPRVTVWDRQGRTSRVPLTAVTYHLTKTDREGNRVFFSKPPEGVGERIPIDKSCDVCSTRGVHKVFYSEFDYVGHMDSFHPREFAIMRENAAAERNSLIGSIARMSPEERAAMRALLCSESENASARRSGGTPERRKAARERAKARMREVPNGID